MRAPKKIIGARSQEQSNRQAGRVHSFFFLSRERKKEESGRVVRCRCRVNYYFFLSGWMVVSFFLSREKVGCEIVVEMKVDKDGSGP